jgi:hypothetical protein
MSESTGTDQLGEKLSIDARRRLGAFDVLYRHLEVMPDAPGRWTMPVEGAKPIRDALDRLINLDGIKHWGYVTKYLDANPDAPDTLSKVPGAFIVQIGSSVNIMCPQVPYYDLKQVERRLQGVSFGDIYRFLAWFGPHSGIIKGDKAVEAASVEIAEILEQPRMTIDELNALVWPDLSGIAYTCA